jgi:PAS domain S-box-containing protein
MLSVSVLRGTDGAARYYISQVEDITARKRAAEAVRLSEAKFSGIVSIATDAIISVDKDQRITVFNEGAESIFGYPKEEAIGMLLHRLIPERFHAAHGDHFAGFARGDETARTMGERREIFGLRKNGEEFPAEASISKVSVGQSPFFSVVLRDVTDRKRAEEALQRALTARDEVLGIVAHDLRNPLSTILMSAALLERPEPEPERRDQKPRLIITRSAKRMNALIQDLLDVAVVEAGQLKVEHERIPAADIARDAVEASSAVAASSSVELLLDVAPGVREVWGDRNRLLQVFDNLIGNALKFTKEGGRVTVRAEVRDQEVVFSVADTGAGIAPENLSHVFDRFWQAATRVRGLGAGLGLPITKGIIEAHGGRIWADSVVERGSTFSFSIPVAPAPSDPPSTRSGDRRHTQRRSAV